jgi:hypothetical protein
MRALRILVISLLVAPIAAGILLVDVWPWHPRSWHAWLLLVILALPILIAGEWVGEKMLTNPLSRSVDRATAKRSFSWVRVVYLLALTIAVLIVLAVVLQHLGVG